MNIWVDRAGTFLHLWRFRDCLTACSALLWKWKWLVREQLGRLWHLDVKGCFSSLLSVCTTTCSQLDMDVFSLSSSSGLSHGGPDSHSGRGWWIKQLRTESEIHSHENEMQTYQPGIHRLFIYPETLHHSSSIQTRSWRSEVLRIRPQASVFWLRLP